MAILARRILLALALCSGMALAPPSLHAQEKPLQLYEQKIKAGLVYNFLKYTTWPANAAPQGTLHVCLFGGDPFDGYLSPLKGRTAQQAVIDITTITRVSEAENCNMVIIPSSQAKSLPALLEFLKDKHVLTVSDIDQFARLGGMVEMTKENEKINLYINKTAVQGAGLGIQGQMLKLAKIVSG
jgi:uncharacterized protein DUF4154